MSSSSSSPPGQSISQPPIHSDASRVSVLSEHTMAKQNQANQQMAGAAAVGGGHQSPSSASVMSSSGATTVAPSWVSGDSETPLLDGFHLPTFNSQGNTLSATGGESGATLSTLLSHANSFGLGPQDIAGVSNGGACCCVGCEF
jgi:hypothetical protein